MLRFYDDELHNLILVANKNFSDIIDYTSEYDFHPPVQYFLNKILLQLFGLNEFWLSLPSVIFIIISITLAGKLVFKITGSAKYSIISSFIIASNPLILLWGSSIRWYSLWTLLAFISIYTLVKLFSQQKTGGTVLLKITMIITLTFALYTNYQTLILIASFIVTAILLDLKTKERKYNHFKLLLPVLIGVGILFIPYSGVFQNHLETFFLRKEIYSSWTGTYSIYSGGYFLFSILFGNSIYPWDLRFIILFLVIVFFGTIFIIFYRVPFFNLLKTYPESTVDKDKRKLLYLLIVLTLTIFLLFLIQAIISNTILSRGLLILPILFVTVAVIFCYFFFALKPIKGSFVLSICLVSFCGIWLIGSYNVFSRQSIHKAGLMDPVEKVIDRVNVISASKENNFIVITFDPVLTFYTLKSELSKKALIISPYKNDSYLLLKSENKIDYKEKLIFDSTATVILIQSYLGSLIPLKEKIDNIELYLHNDGILIHRNLQLGYDPDAGIKRKFFASAEIKTWRYTIITIKPITYWNYDVINEINSLKVH